MPVSKTIAKQLENASWIRRMFEEGVRLKRERGADAICDFSLGNPDVEPPPAVLDALRRVAAGNRSGSHGYMPNPGYPQVREAVAKKLQRETGLDFTAEDIFMTVGSAGACNVILKSILDPGDEVIVLMPCFSEYRFYIANHNGCMVPVETDATFLPVAERIAAAITPRTRAIILNTPNNPTGKVFTRSELEFIRDLCVRWNAFCITDEIYEHILYDGTEHITMARIDGMRDRTIVINGMSKTYSVTGWRVGWAIAPPEATASIRKVHDFLTVGAAAPLQQAGATALKQPQSYYDKLATSYAEKRARLLKILTQAGFTVFKPRGAYYIMTDISRFPDPDPKRFPAATRDVRFSKYLVEEIGVATVPGSSFYNDPNDGATQIRFTFCKKEETLAAAEQRLAKLKLATL